MQALVADTQREKFLVAERVAAHLGETPESRVGCRSRVEVLACGWCRSEIQPSSFEKFTPAKVEVTEGN